MGFRINTNVGAMNAHMMSVNNNRGLDKSLAALSSGLRINKAADDASGMAIANQLKSQAQGLGQAIRNANDGINVAQTADGALEEYTNIINTVRTKAIQAASDGQNANSRGAIQRDIDKLLEEANNIAKTTSFNGQKLLDGTFTDKKFQIGAYANETVGISVSSAKIDSVGSYAEETGASAVGTSALDAGSVTINTVSIGASTAGTGDGRTADSAWSKINAINAKTSETGVTATAETKVTGSAAVAAGSISAGELTINGVDIGAVTVLDNDSDHALMDAINSHSGDTHVTASIDDDGALVLTADEGENIVIADGDDEDAVTFIGAATNRGTITLSSSEGAIAVTEGTTAGATIGTGDTTIAETGNLGTINVKTFDGAQTAIKITDAALKEIDKMRSNIGSVQNQLESTVRNISVTQVNATAAESTIRDVDFAAESATLQKHNILAKSGVYAMSQANAAQQNVMRLLQ